MLHLAACCGKRATRKQPSWMVYSSKSTGRGVRNPLVRIIVADDVLRGARPPRWGRRHIAVAGVTSILVLAPHAHTGDRRIQLAFARPHVRSAAAAGGPDTTDIFRR